VPTGGMGNNTGFAGIRNLAWKLAFVLRGVSPPSLLETYEEEHKPLAVERIALGVRITQAMIPMMFKFMAGQDIREDIEATRLYGNYDGTLLGFESKSHLIAEEDSAPPSVDDPVMDFVPAVRAGLRAPHDWVDDSRTVSVLDGFGTGYSLVLGADVILRPWAECVEQLSNDGVPISIQQLPTMPATGNYEKDAVVLVRPDGIVADHWKGNDMGDPDRTARLKRHLPLT